MSLVIALYTDSKRYALASDSRATGNPSGMNNRVVKGHRMGDWLVGFAGGIVGGQRMIARLKREYQHTSWQSREDVETQIRKAFATVVGDCGPTVPGNYPGIGADMLFVGPLGIAAMAPEGSIHWRPSGVQYWAIGCGDGYAMGWLDSAQQGGATLTDWEIFDAICGAAELYPAIGGEVRIELSSESEAAKLREEAFRARNSEILSISQAAKLLGISSADTIKNWLAGGAFPGAYRTAGGDWQFPRHAVVTVKRHMDETRARNSCGDLAPTDTDDDSTPPLL